MYSFFLLFSWWLNFYGLYFETYHVYPSVFVLLELTCVQWILRALLTRLAFFLTIYLLQELLALGVLNFISSFFSCLSTSGGFSLTNVLAYSGSKTQLANILSSLIVLVVMLKLGPLFEPLPQVILLYSVEGGLSLLVKAYFSI